jgi:hypothetical protein
MYETKQNPFVEDVFNGVPAANIYQQSQDLATLKRLQDLAKQIEYHVNVIAQAQGNLAQLRSDIEVSARDFHMGAMPDWYEASAIATRASFENAMAELEYIKNRLHSEYLS